MLVARQRDVVSLMLVCGLAIGCGSSGAMDEADTGAGGEVAQPLPGVDVDRDTAVGQVVDAHGLSGWYPHEGSLMEYRVAIRFGQEPNTMPEGWGFGRVSAVATDSNNQVFVFHRGDVADPIVVFDSEGNYLRSFGRGMFNNEHGLRIDRHDNVWVTDNGDHQVMKFSNDGELLMTLGIRARPARPMRPSIARPTFPSDSTTSSMWPTGMATAGSSSMTRTGTSLPPGAPPARGRASSTSSTRWRSTPRVASTPAIARTTGFRSSTRTGELLNMWTHLGATQNIFITPDDQVWVITHRDNVENITYDTLAGRIMRVDIETGEIVGAMESPGHWIDVSHTGEIFIGSLTGNVFRWYEGWMETQEAAQAERP